MPAAKKASDKKSVPATTMTKTKRRAPRPVKPATGGVRIRMYNVGFGDAFLLHLPTSDGDRTVLIDCGQHLGGIANPMNSVLDDLIGAVTSGDQAHIDVVIATHRHFDHISGFDSAKWKAVDVGEVWMPWTEEHGVPAADAIRRSQNRVAQALHSRFGGVDTKIGFFALNSFGNKGAENTLRTGFVGERKHRYLPADQRTDRTFTTSLLPGVTVHALGPSRSPDVIATMMPPEEQIFHALAAHREAVDNRTDTISDTSDDSMADTGDASVASDDAPVADSFPDLFAARYVVDTPDYGRRYPELSGHASSAQVIKAAEEDLLAGASAMEDAINGTSLMLMFEVGNQCLLFAGDAEWGTWSEVLADEAWRELLARTTVYKVSHHGSLNGTPIDFVDELLPQNAISLMSFRDVKKWPSIPRKGLTDALAEHSRTLIRSDEIHDAPGTSRHGDLWIELTIPVSS